MITWKHVHYGNIMNDDQVPFCLTHASPQWLMKHEEKYQSSRQIERSTVPAVDGYIQSRFISAIFVSLIMHGIEAPFDSHDDDNEKAEKSFYLNDFFNGYEFPKIGAIKNMMVDNLTRFNKNSIATFVVALAMMDTDIKWFPSDDNGEGYIGKKETQIELRGALLLAVTGKSFGGRLLRNTYTYDFLMGEADIIVDEMISYRHEYRDLFAYIRKLFDRTTKIEQ